MYRNHVSIPKNRLYVMAEGKMEVDEVKLASADVLRLAKQLKPGFSIISDVSRFMPVTEEGRLVMQGAMKAAKELGMGHAVRIVPSAAQVVANQWQRSSRSAGYVAEQAPTLAEAERLLDELGKA